MDRTNGDAIGVFDSGVGGISVLLEAVKSLPAEDFIYYGDNGNAPYGTKTEEKIRELTNASVDFLLEKGIKALVVACNTATSAAIISLRERLQIPVIGMEPAVKPAITKYGAEKVYVLATPATLKLQKFNDLVTSLSEEAEILSVPCPGLVELIEKGIINGNDIRFYMDHLFYDKMPKSGDVVVLGCTHYVFLKPFLKEYFPEGVEVIDGNKGTINQLIKKLEELNALSSRADRGTIQIFTSGENAIYGPVFDRLMAEK